MNTESSSHAYASVKKRIFAKFIDLLIVIFLGVLWFGGPGSILGFLYSITADGLPFQKWKGQSVGKKFMKIQVLPHSLKASILRNAPVGIVTLLMIIPFWGWILSLLVGVPLCLIEISLIVRAQKHQRLGDVMAETEVFQVNAASF
jgi:uncharacterized RDD family membrane protein YckC